MNELVELLKSRVGLDDQKAQSAAQSVIDFLKQRLPGPVASQIESAVGGGGIQGAKEMVGEKLGGILDKSA
jgi:hypothetical protein